MNKTTTYKGVEIELKEGKYWLYGKVFLNSEQDAKLLIDSILFSNRREEERKKILRKNLVDSKQ